MHRRATHNILQTTLTNNPTIIPHSSQNCIWSHSKNASNKHLQNNTPQIQQISKLNNLWVLRNKSRTKLRHSKLHVVATECSRSMFVYFNKLSKSSTNIAPTIDLHASLLRVSVFIFVQYVSYSSPCAPTNTSHVSQTPSKTSNLGFFAFD